MQAAMRSMRSTAGPGSRWAGGSTVGSSSTFQPLQAIGAAASVRHVSAVCSSSLSARRRGPLVCRAHDAVQPQGDEFVSAARRLQNLLAGVGDGESEMLDSTLADESPESRILMLLVLGSVLGGVSVAVSLLAGQDPLGGASLSGGSLMAACTGLLAVTPLVAFRVWSWRPEAAEVLPAFEDMHLAQVAIQAPWFARTTPVHVAVMTCIETMPSILLALPAMQGALLAATHMYSTALQSLGAPGTASPGVLQLSCLLFTAALAALGKGLELGVSDQEYEVVQAAVDNSDRYYRLMADRGSRAAEAALAFRSVAQAWLGARNDASLAAMGVAAVDILTYGGLWYATGDLAAAAAAAVALNGVDAYHIHRVVRRREEKAALAGVSRSSGKGDGSA